MKFCYQKALTELINIVEKSRDKIQENHRNFESSMRKLVFLGDKQYGTYKSIVETNEYRAIKAIESITICLLSEYNCVDFSVYPKTQAIFLPFQIVLKEKGKRIGLIFCDSSDIGEKAKCFKCGKYNVDALKIVMLSAPDSFAHEAYVNTANQRAGIDIERVPILEFWERYFGNSECEELIEFFNQFNDKAKEVIGFNTVIVPTEKALENFRKRCGDVLIKAAISQNIPEAFSSEYGILKYNYLERQLWRTMVGKNNFAISFITSEWFYDMYQLTENLDLTTVVAGYLKSVEQLLFAIIQLSAGTGITIRGKSRKIVELTKENEDVVDTTLGALEKVIEYNGKILEINTYAKKCLLSIIDEWREKQRNGYFHKHNLHSLNKVEEIRQKAFQLYFLILGSCTIKDEQFQQLGIEL